jgi:monoamine oxidase
MARTPLLRSIRSLFADLRVSRATGIPVRELPGRRLELRVGRREFLRAASAGAGVLAASFARPASAARRPTVAIVGAGIAGLSCALRLADHGVGATVYEGSGRIGGRMFSNNGGYWNEGQVSEWCGELIDTGHTTIRSLARRFDLRLDDLHAAEPAGSTETYRFFDQYYPKAHADADFLEIFDALQQDADEAGYPTTFDAFTPEGKILDHTSVYDWIESRVPGGHRSPFGQLLDVAYNIEYGSDTTVQSSLNLIYLLAFQPEDEPFAVFGVSDERFHIRGGNQLLPQSIARYLGDSVVTGHKLSRIERTAGGRVVLTFDVGSTTRQIIADYAVLALPFAVLRELDYSRAGFSSLKNTAIHDLGRGHNGKLQLQFDKRLWTQRGPWGISSGSSYADTGYQSSWEVSRAQPGGDGLLVFYSGGGVTDSMTTNAAFTTIQANAGVATDASRALAQVSMVFPGLAPLWNGRATQSLPHKFPFMNASYSYWRVGQYTGFSGIEGVPEGNIFFCGEHTSQDFQGFMEGGASTGLRTASDLLDVIRGR